MKSLKKFIEKKKADKRFKHAGQGYSLVGGSTSAATSSSSPPKQDYKPPPVSADRRIRSDTAAEAAAKRLQPEPGLSAAQRRIREEARKQLEEEEQRQRETVSDSKLPADKRDGFHDFEHSDQISTLLYTCDLLDAEKVLPRKEMMEEIEKYLRAMLDEEPLEASIVMIWSLNNYQKVELAVPILLKYLTNIVNAPEEEKFRQIRTSNKIFLEKIASLKGGIEFLKSVGFIEDDRPNADGSIDTFLALPEPDENVLESLESAASALDNDSRVVLKLYRDPKVFRINPSEPIPRPEIPSDFFNLSPAELQKEQQRRSADVEKLTTLRTAKMRENDARLRQYNYKYTLIRIRFPNCYILQGVFKAHESFGAVRDFVADKVSAMLGEFKFTDPTSGKQFDQDEPSFYDYGLVPAALIHFDWDKTTLTQLAASSQQPVYLHPKHEQSAVTL